MLNAVFFFASPTNGIGCLSWGSIQTFYVTEEDSVGEGTHGEYNC